MSLLHAVRRAVRDTEGSEVLEFALVLPILLVVMGGIVDAGFLFNNYEVVTNAAREGARLGALPGFDDDDVIDRVNDYLAAGGLDPAKATVVPTPDDLDVLGHTVHGVKVTVTYTYDYLLLGPLANAFYMKDKPLDNSVTVTAKATMRRELAAGL